MSGGFCKQREHITEHREFFPGEEALSMMKITKKLNNAIFLFAFLAAMFTVTWRLTTITPLVGDDYNYAFTWTDHSRIDNFTLVCQSMNTHRNWTHGRVFAQGWVSLFMMWPEKLFSFANASVVTAFFVALHHYFRRVKVEKPIESCMAVAVLYWICMPAFGQVFLWLDGACNYFWGAALSGILLETEFSFKETKHRLLLAMLLFPFAFAAGAWSEHISFAFLVIQFLYIMSLLKQNRKLPKAETLIFLTSCAGYLFLMLAPSMLPSILRRRAMQAAGEHLETMMELISEKWWLIPILLLCGFIVWYILRKKPDKNMRWTLVFKLAALLCVLADVFYITRIVLEQTGWDTVLFTLVSSTQVGFLTLMACYCSCLASAFRQKIDKCIIREAVILGAGGISALLLFVLAMYVPARGFCAPVVFIGIATVRLYTALQHKISWAVLIALLTVFVLFFTVGVSDVMHVYRAAIERDKAITAALSTDGILIASPYPEKTKYSAQYGIQDLTDDGSWPNDVIIEYYGLKDIHVISADG